MVNFNNTLIQDDEQEVTYDSQNYLNIKENFSPNGFRSPLYKVMKKGNWDLYSLANVSEAYSMYGINPKSVVYSSNTHTEVVQAKVRFRYISNNKSYIEFPNVSYQTSSNLYGSYIQDIQIKHPGTSTWTNIMNPNNNTWHTPGLTTAFQNLTFADIRFTLVLKNLPAYNSDVVGPATDEFSAFKEWFEQCSNVNSEKFFKFLATEVVLNRTKTSFDLTFLSSSNVSFTVPVNCGFTLNGYTMGQGASITKSGNGSITVGTSNSYENESVLTATMNSMEHTIKLVYHNIDTNWDLEDRTVGKDSTIVNFNIESNYDWKIVCGSQGVRFSRTSGTASSNVSKWSVNMYIDSLPLVTQSRTFNVSLVKVDGSTETTVDSVDITQNNTTLQVTNHGIMLHENSNSNSGEFSLGGVEFSTEVSFQVTKVQFPQVYYSNTGGQGRTLNGWSTAYVTNSSHNIVQTIRLSDVTSSGNVISPVTLPAGSYNLVYEKSDVLPNFNGWDSPPDSAYIAIKINGVNSLQRLPVEKGDFSHVIESETWWIVNH